MFNFNNFSTCFGHHYAHLQENKMYVTACGVLRCNKRGKLDISFNVFFVWYCVVNLDGISCVCVCIWECGVQIGVSWCWTGICIVCFPGLVYRSGCTDACVVPVWWEGCVVQVLLGALGEVCRWWAGWYRGWRFNVTLATYLVLLDVVGSGCGALPCGCEDCEGYCSTSRVM